jgi:hypothetical protein
MSVDDVIRKYGAAARYGAAANGRVSAVNARRLAGPLKFRVSREHWKVIDNACL